MHGLGMDQQHLPPRFEAGEPEITIHVANSMAPGPMDGRVAPVGLHIHTYIHT